MKTNQLKQIVEMVAAEAPGSVRFVPAQPSFGRHVDQITIDTGYRAVTEELRNRCEDAAIALNIGVTLGPIRSVSFARGTVSEGRGYISVVVLS